MFQHAMAESVADSLLDDPNVVETAVEKGKRNEKMVVCTVFNEHCERRVKRTLDEYPVYVQLRVQDEAM